MGTQGLLTVMKNDEVVAKLVVGCNGENIKSIKKLIAIESVVDIEVFYKMASNVNFGCEDCLVVMDKDHIKDSGSSEYIEDDSIDFELYIRTFDLPNFNPRWKEGSADYIERVSI